MKRCRQIVTTAILIALPLGTAIARHRDKAPPDWQAIVAPDDRTRLHLWRTAWMDGLRQARSADAARIGADILFDPDVSLPDPAPPPGLYRCRTYRLGAQRAGDPAFVAGAPQPCRIGSGRFAVLSGMQRPEGRLWPYDTTRLVFLGALALGDEPRALNYGRDSVRDMVGLLERIDAARWRLALPRPRWQSQIDIVEITRGDG